jgi:hypothetical protein
MNGAFEIFSEKYQNDRNKIVDEVLKLAKEGKRKEAQQLADLAAKFGLLHPMEAMWILNGI